MWPTWFRYFYSQDPEEAGCCDPKAAVQTAIRHGYLLPKIRFGLHAAIQCDASISNQLLFEAGRVCRDSSGASKALVKPSEPVSVRCQSQWTESVDVHCRGWSGKKGGNACNACLQCMVDDDAVGRSRFCGLAPKGLRLAAPAQPPWGSITHRSGTGALALTPLPRLLLRLAGRKDKAQSWAAYEAASTSGKIPSAAGFSLCLGTPKLKQLLLAVFSSGCTYQGAWFRNGVGAADHSIVPYWLQVIVHLLVFLT